MHHLVMCEAGHEAVSSLSPQPRGMLARSTHSAAPPTLQAPGEAQNLGATAPVNLSHWQEISLDLLLDTHSSISTKYKHTQTHKTGRS